MGSWSVSCGISNIAIVANSECCILPLYKARSEYQKYLPVMLPIFGTYDDYGGMEDIDCDDNTALIEAITGVTIEEFVKFLVDGRWTYYRDEVEEIENKMRKHGSFEDFENVRFMWINKHVYDFLSKFKSVNDYKGKKEIEDYTWLFQVREEHRQWSRFLEKNEIISDYEKRIYVETLRETLAFTYFDNWEQYGERVMGIARMRLCMYTMSTPFRPYRMYQTPQCGEHEEHQIFLQEFMRINKLYCEKENEEDEEE